MPKGKVRDLLKCAQDNHFAVAAVDIYNYESASWVVKAAEMERVPVILMFYPTMQSFIPFSMIGSICNQIAELSAVPVGVHLDHSHSYDDVISGIPGGFQSIMFDGSSLPFHENADITSQVVRTAHLFGTDVEAELGYVGKGSRLEDFTDTDLFTKPEEAVRFVEQTGVDSLAVAIGNSHGNYICEPNLDISRLDAIHRSIETPLVLHGGSGIPPEQVSEAVNYGIRKMNIGTEFFARYKEMCGKFFTLESSVLSASEKAGGEVIDLVIERIRRLNPKGYHL